MDNTNKSMNKKVKWAIAFINTWYDSLPNDDRNKPFWFIPDGIHGSGVTIKQMIMEIQSKTEVGLCFASSLYDTAKEHGLNC